MRALMLVLVVGISGCAAIDAAFDAPVPEDMRAAARSLSSPEMEAAIAAARPGVPRE